jgi:hypothetical protein
MMEEKVSTKFNEWWECYGKKAALTNITLNFSQFNKLDQLNILELIRMNAMLAWYVSPVIKKYELDGVRVTSTEIYDLAKDVFREYGRGKLIFTAKEAVNVLQKYGHTIKKVSRR